MCPFCLKSPTQHPASPRACQTPLDEWTYYWPCTRCELHPEAAAPNIINKLSKVTTSEQELTSNLSASPFQCQHSSTRLSCRSGHVFTNRTACSRSMEYSRTWSEVIDNPTPHSGLKIYMLDGAPIVVHRPCIGCASWNMTNRAMTEWLHILPPTQGWGIQPMAVVGLWS